MPTRIARSIPHKQLRKLDFLIGDAAAVQTIYPPGEKPIQFKAVLSSSRESCERFLRFDYYSCVPGLGEETYRALMTWSEKANKYTMWAFCASQEEPLYLEGDFENDKLVLTSNPWPMPWGLQRLRSTFTPLQAGGFEYLCELWALDGYVKYYSVIFQMPE